MAMGVFDQILIRGLACAVPKNTVQNTSYYDVFGKEIVDKFINIVGVKERHIANPQQTTGDLCFVAADRLIEKIGWARESIDAIILATQTPDYDAPATACILQNRLGLSEDCLAFDMNLGCSNFIYGMFVASSILQNPLIKRVLFLNGETSETDNHDQATAMMFGDAGAATALEKGVGEKMHYLLKTDGARYDKIITPNSAWRHRDKVDGQRPYHGLMDGPAVFDFTLFDVPAALKEYLKIYNTQLDQYDYCILHQANLMAMRQIAKRIELPLDKLAVSIDRFGNTNGTSIPLTVVDLCEKVSNITKLKLILSGYGVGFSWGVMDMVLDPAVVLPMIYTDDYFKEAFAGL